MSVVESGQGSGVPRSVNVAIISADASDRARLVDIVSALGYEAFGFVNIADYEAFEQSTRAALVCFRVATATSRVPSMPSSARVGRLLVLSDLEDEQHIVDTLNAGASHHFKLDEPMAVTSARLQAALRWHDPFRNRTIEVSPFKFELAHRRVILQERVLDLSPREFDLAFYLFSNRGRIVTNGELLTSVWSLPQDIDTRRIDTAACRVRKKMSLGDHTGWVLRRFRREGYGLYWDTRGAAVPVAVSKERRETEALD